MTLIITRLDINVIKKYSNGNENNFQKNNKKDRNNNLIYYSSSFSGKNTCSLVNNTNVHKQLGN